jgi:hypothetical protein
MEFEMFTAKGDKACQSLVEKMTKKIHSKRRYTAEEMSVMLKEGVAKIEAKHGEVTDTEPRWHIAKRVSKELKSAGYSFYFNGYQDIETIE